VEASAQIQASMQAPKGQVLYRVVEGSYSVRENAENQVQKLKAVGVDAKIMIFK